jgi:cell division protein FtsL
MVGPFVVFGLVVVASMIGIVMARTSLDAGAFDLADLNRKIAVEQQRQQTLTVEAARLESPGRIAPLADKMGLVQAQDPTILVVGEAASNDATSNANLAMEQRP